jgi:hypothetical protein
MVFRVSINSQALMHLQQIVIALRIITINMKGKNVA